jgi:hypothetical protein
VQTAANAERRKIGRRFASTSCSLDHRRQRVAAVVEGRVESVAGHLDDGASMALDRGARDLVVPRHRARGPTRVGFPQARAALDIREQVGDCRGSRLDHRCAGRSVVAGGYRYSGRAQFTSAQPRPSVDADGWRTEFL